MSSSLAEHTVFAEIASTKMYRYCVAGVTDHVIELMPEYVIAAGSGSLEQTWSIVRDAKGDPSLLINGSEGTICTLQRDEDGTWRGEWSKFGAPAVELIPILTTATAAEVEHYRQLQIEAIAAIPAYPEGEFNGRGIVLVGGGDKYFPGIWALVNLLRRTHGCTLPIEVWYLGPEEIGSARRELLERLDVRCVDALEVRNSHPARRLGGWELKPFAIIHSRFAEVIYLDADNVPVTDPAVLFDTLEYARHGAIFWPDFGRLSERRAIWKICGLNYRDEAEFESGQIVMDKKRSWRALHLAMHMNEYSDFYYHHINGDKETFHMAWRMLGTPYTMIPHRLRAIQYTMLQHDPSGAVIFQHRYGDKWTLYGSGARIAGFLFEDECLEYLRELREHIG